MSRLTIRFRTVIVALSATLVLSTVVAGVGGAAPVVVGSAGIQESLLMTDSAVTIRGRDDYAGMEITVNQTKNLVNQAVSVSWTGSSPTNRSPYPFSENFVQVMQCWGDDDGTVTENPGPPPEQCVFGASEALLGGSGANIFAASSFTHSRVVSKTQWPNYRSDIGVTDPTTGWSWRPFRSVDGTTTGIGINSAFNPLVEGSGDYWLNPYFNIRTTNEIAGSPTRQDGKGEDLFQINTGLESTGLGCGQRVQSTLDGGTKVPKCWLVIVPRGSAEGENEGTLNGGASASNYGVVTSPLSPAAWENRVAVPLEFNPVDSGCSISDKARQAVGTELVLAAVASWQPAICGSGALPPLSYTTVSDSSARQQLSSSLPGAPGMAVTSRPLDPAVDTPQDPVVYAPVALSGVVIAFNVERTPRLDAPTEEKALAGSRIGALNLTPRLVAKLLTQSYRMQTRIGSGDPGYDWAESNPNHLGVDPDFLQFNPEFSLLSIGFMKNFGGLSLPALNSDAAGLVWQWILADPEASEWLKGAEDEWGMRVNPVYATDPAVNPTGLAFADPAPESFPKADPYCYQAPPPQGNTAIIPTPLCGTDWLPYVGSFRDAARVARIASDGAKVTANTNAQTSDQYWRADGPQYIGQKAYLTLTDSSSAATFGLQTAKLSRAGDNDSDRTFSAPDAAGMSAAVEAMEPGSDPDVMQPNHLAAGRGSYPLTLFAYAQVRPLRLDQEAREDYASVIEYATGAGQVAGLESGQLPRGYLPLPPGFIEQARRAAQTIRTIAAPPVVEQTNAPGTVTQGVDWSSPGSGSPARSSGNPVAASAAPEAAIEVVPAASGEQDVPGILTPILALARNRFFLVVLAAVAVASALGALEITKRPRRSDGRRNEVS